MQLYSRRDVAREGGGYGDEKRPLECCLRAEWLSGAWRPRAPEGQPQPSRRAATPSCRCQASWRWARSEAAVSWPGLPEGSRGLCSDV